MSIYANDGDFLPRLGLDRTMADALAVYVEQTIPVQGRRKAVAVLWDLGLDEARTVIEARPSRTTLDRIFKHPNGGWRVILPVMGAVVGQSADASIINEKRRLADERRSFEEREAHLDQVARDLRTVSPVLAWPSDRKAG